MYPYKLITIAELKALPPEMFGAILEWLVAQEI
jgi:hypothetical protein